MQRWCPEPLVPDQPAAAAAAGGAGRFRLEAALAERPSLLDRLGCDERARLLASLEVGLRAEYDARLAAELARTGAEQAAAREAELAAAAACHEALVAGATAAYDALARELTEAAVSLAVQLAEKLVRARVAADPGVLARAVETVLFKSEPGVTLQVTCHPDDAALLRESADLRARLRVTEIKEDRRLQRGGCLVRAGDLEWDATIRRQLAVLEEAARAALAGTAAPAEAAGDAAPTLA